MNTLNMKLKITLSGGTRLTFSLVLATGLLFASGQAIAADALEKTKIFLWLSALPDWMPSVLLIAALTGLSWMGFVVLRRRLLADGYDKHNKRIGYYAVAVAALVGILLSPLVTNTWNNYLSEAINNLPPSAAGTVSVNLTWSASTASNVGGYIVYYGTSSGVYTSSVDVGNTTSTTLTGLQGGTAYYFAISAYDTTRAFQSRYSNETNVNAPDSPTVSFTASQTSGNYPLAVSFTPATTGAITGWQWSFGDGTINAGSSSPVPTAIMSYGSMGTYTVSLTVTGPGGRATQTLSNPITVTSPPPTVSFTASQTGGNALLGVTFTPATTGIITGWQWSFGDGSTSSGMGSSVPATVKWYGSAGAYTVSLTVTGPGGSVTQTLSNPITVTSSTVSNTSPNSNGLVAAYGFDESNGTIVQDASGTGNNGTITGATRVTNGRFGNALKFSGKNASPNWVNVSNSTSLALSAGMTLEAWVYPTTPMSGDSTVVMKQQPNTGSYDDAYLLAANSSANQPMSDVWTGGEVAVGGNTQIPPNQWTHLATTYDGNNQSLYINGVLVNIMPQTGPITPSTGLLQIGGNSIWGGYFQGYIDEVRIYNQALTNAQILSDSTTAISVSNPLKSIAGDQNVESTVISLPAGTAQAFQITPQTTKTLTNIQVYVDASSTATGLRTAIFTTTADGHPRSLWGSAGILTALQAGAWNSITLSPLSLSAGQSYWIVILGTGGTLNLRGQPGTGTNLTETSASSTLTSLPNSWTTGVVSTGGPESVYGAGY